MLKDCACSRYLEEREGDTTVHLEHLLATREQELRALLAEKESLHNQNRQTWSLLEERTQENSQLQVQAFVSATAFLCVKDESSRHAAESRVLVLAGCVVESGHLSTAVETKVADWQRIHNRS